MKIDSKPRICYNFTLSKSYNATGMLIKSRAIVLHTQKYNDTSFIVLLYTEAEGSVSFVVRIPKTSRAAIKNKLFQPLALLSIEWDMRDNQSLQHLRTCSSLRPYASLPYNPYKATVSLFVYEFLFHALRSEKGSSETFEYVLNSLLWLDMKDEKFSNFHLVFMAKFSHFLGFEPNISELGKNVVFDMQNSSFVDSVPSHPYYIKGVESQMLPILLRVNYRSMHLLRLSRNDRNRILDLLCLYYRLHVPGFPELKSLDILRTLFD